MALGLQENASLQAETSTATQGSATMTSRPIPRLPADIIQTIFDFIDALEDHPLVAQKRWVTLSLVQKEWARLAVRYRRTFILPTTSSVNCFASHAVKLLSAGIRIRELRIEDVWDSKELLLKLLPLVAPTLTSVSVPLNLVDSREVNDLCSPETCKLVKLHLYNGAAPMHYLEYRHSGLSWDKASTILGVPTLLHLELAHVILDGSLEDFGTATACHVRTLHLRNVHIRSLEALDYQAALLVDQVQHLSLANVQFDANVDALAPLELSRIFGKKLVSLRMDPASLERVDEHTCFETFSGLLPVLQTLEMQGADHFECFIGGGHPCFLRLPESLRHCSIGPMNWESASAYLERKRDPTYLPNLQASSVLWVDSDDRMTHGDEVEEYNQRRLEAEGDKYAYAFELRWDYGREE